MTAKKKFIGHCLGGILTLVFLFPSLLQFEHLFENHKHEICNENTVHIHQKNLNCNIYDFHFSFFSFLPYFSEDVLIYFSSYSPVLSETVAIINYPNFQNALRGPPIMLDFTV